MRVQNISVRAFFKQDDLLDGRRMLSQLLPEDTVIAEEMLEPESEGGVFNEPLFALKAAVSKQSQVKQFINKLLSGLDSAEIQELRDTLESRIDDDCNFYIRLDKKKMLEGKLALHTRDPVHVRIKMACFPKKRADAVRIAGEILNGDL
jgi:hypothetical protein